MELIDKAKILKKKTTLYISADSEETFSQDWEPAVVFVEDIKKAPVVDAVPVVRCGECRHHRPIDYCELHKCKGWFNDKHCSYGEPRTPPAE